MSPQQAKEEYANFLKNIKLFEIHIQAVFDEWLYSCEHFLTNQNINRIAWIGQAAMCHYSSISSFYRGGFYNLTVKEQKKANNIAYKWLIKWLSDKYKQQHKEQNKRIYPLLEN